MFAQYGDSAWRDLLRGILINGRPVAPRGQPTLEILHTNNIQVDMRRAVVTSPERKLNYRFMAAEALWILSGSNQLSPLTRFIKRFSDFSDDGETLFGAYGPPVTAQLPYVVESLLKDRDTRQAVLTIWRQSPKPSKDIPCTIAMTFSIREDRLHQHVFMRSSDAWLGIPYDMFSFACIGLRVACDYNRGALAGQQDLVLPGMLTISMTSSHLYERDIEAVRNVIASPKPQPITPCPTDILLDGNWNRIAESLEAIREDARIPAGGWELRDRDDRISIGGQ